MAVSAMVVAGTVDGGLEVRLVRPGEARLDGEDLVGAGENRFKTAPCSLTAVETPPPATALRLLTLRVVDFAVVTAVIDTSAFLVRPRVMR